MAVIRPGGTGPAIGGGLGAASRAVFPSPFLDVVDLTIPQDIKSILRVSEAIYFYNPMVKAGIDRLVSYPVTRFEYETENQELKKQYQHIHSDILNLQSFLVELGKDVWVYGNCFVSPYFPFDRYLRCPTCKFEQPLSKVKTFKFSKLAFTTTCKCGYSGVHERIDRRNLNVDRFRMIRWNPHLIFTLYNEISGKATYWYQLDGETRSKIMAGDRDILCDTPWEFIVAVSKGQKFKFRDDMIFHIKQPTLSGRAKSWGLPPTLPLMKLHYFTAALRRANIALAYDMSVPFRVMYPERGGAVGDPAVQLSMRNWVANAQKMVREHRIEPTRIQFSPGPVGFQSVGGDARALMYSQEIRQANEEIMAALHIPQDLFYGTLTAQAAPVALRLLHNVMNFYLQGLDKLCVWINRHISEYFAMEYVPFKLQNFVELDDLGRTQAVVQLNSLGKISDTTLMEAYGMDADIEYMKLLDEQARRAALTQEMSEAQAQSDAGPGMTPADSVSQAQQLAQQWLSMPLEQRRSAMHQAKMQDATMYEAALNALYSLRKMARRAGAAPGMEAAAMSMIPPEGQGQGQALPTAASPEPEPKEVKQPMATSAQSGSTTI